jgi:hypothetical protein
MRARFGRSGIFVTKSVDVEVEVVLEDLVENLDDDDNSEVLEKLGLVKAIGIRPTQKTWECVARALRNGDQRELVDLLSTLAWDQANVVIRPIL